MKKYINISKYWPKGDMELLLEYNSNNQCIYFKGSKTPSKYINKGFLNEFKIKGVSFLIQSYSHPQINIEYWSDKIVELYLGGEESNPSQFSEMWPIGDMKYYNGLLDLFIPQSLNKNTRVI